MCLLTSTTSRDAFYIQFTAISSFKITPKICKACAKIQKLGVKLFRHLIWSQRLHKRSWGRKRETEVTNVNYLSANIQFNIIKPKICVGVDFRVNYSVRTILFAIIRLKMICFRSFNGICFLIARTFPVKLTIGNRGLKSQTFSSRLVSEL